MSLTAGIVGLPNVGKSTLFNAITKKHILAENYPFATIDPNIGVVTVPDKRIDNLNKMYNPNKLIPTSYEFTDIAGLVKGASKGEGLGNKFLSHIRETDAICEVVRCFENDKIIHVDGDIDPIRDVETINLELSIADLDIVNNRLEKVAKKARTSKDKNDLLEVEALEKAKKSLESNIPLRLVEYTEEEKQILKSYSFLTIKPIIYLANVTEDEVSQKDNELVQKVKEYAGKEKAPVVKLCAKLAWTFKKGMNAKKCAGLIHTDFEKGFIKAEVISYEDLIKYGDELKVRENGRARLEGKDYLMQDGDICHFRFNV